MSAGEGTTDTTSGAPGSWADALRFPPWIADERDGTIFRNLPAMAFQRPLNVSEGCADTDASASMPGSLSTHDNPNSPEV